MAKRIAVDAMGGDDAPSVVVKGAIEATQAAGSDVQVLLFGPEARVHEELAQHASPRDLPIQVVDAPEVIAMGESPSSAVKGKPESSIHCGLGAHAQDQADAFVSAGNTGAIMAASLFILGRVPGVERPTIVGYFPTTQGTCLVTDIGSNVDCKPQHLAQFARMSTLFAENIVGLENPRVGLLNVGEEPGKGNEQAKRAYELLQATPGIHFAGNIEGGDILRHGADIVICDGFVGNIVLKFGESLFSVIAPMVQREMARQELSPSEQQVVGRVLSNVRKGFESEERGGASLLGVKGNVMIGHGRSSARAVKQLILSAAEIAAKDVLHPMIDAFAE